MYKVSRRINYTGGDISSDITKCDMPQEAVAWINKMVGNFAPISKKNENRILDMLPGDKVKFKICDMSISVKCS